MSNAVSAEFYWVAVALVTVISASRITRLTTVDKFPPAAWVREKYADLTGATEWVWLLFCGYCFSFWAALGVVAWGYITDWNTAWWLVNGVLASSYLAAVFMAHDGDDGDDGDDETSDGAES